MVSPGAIGFAMRGGRAALDTLGGGLEAGMRKRAKIILKQKWYYRWGLREKVRCGAVIS